MPNNMKKAYNTSRNSSGFSLAEVLVALTIGTMILVSILSIYARARRSAAAITDRLDSSRLPSEVLQRIAEDLDRIIMPISDTRITIDNKFDSRGYQTARLQILKTIYDGKNKPQTFEEIIWQASYDYDSDANGLVLYRSHTGITSEDKLLDKSRADWEDVYTFIPICTGVTFFKIQVPADGNLLDQWTDTSLPRGIMATISFAEPFKTITGTLNVPDEEKVSRTIAIDRTRKIKFEIVKEEYTQEPNEQENQQEQEEQVDANSTAGEG